MARLRSRGGLSLTFWSPITTSPEVTSSRPTIIRRTVDFPHPDGPTRIMNSLSAMSRLTSSTAGGPSPKLLVMCSSLMLAMETPWALALHGAGGQPGDDLALEDEDERHHRDRHDHRGGGDGGGRLLEERLAGEERQRRGHRAGFAGRGQRDAEHEVVPGEEERQDPRGEHAGRRERHDDLAEGLPRRRAVDLRGLLHLPRDLAEERRQH